MYFPYLRAKQYELYALNEAAIWLSRTKNITPILEPVTKDKKPLQATLKAYNSLGTRCIVIANPKVGNLVGESLFDLIRSTESPKNKTHLGFILSHNETLKDVKDFLKQAKTNSISFIHASEFKKREELIKLSKDSVRFNVFLDGMSGVAYQNSFANRVLIRDPFRKADRNSDYLDRQDEFFSDWHLQFERLGLVGYGDYSVIGKEYQEKGGVPYSVALHYVYSKAAENGNQLWVKHFVSEMMSDTPANVEGKFAEAVKKLVQAKKPVFKSNHCAGCKSYGAHYHSKEFHGLGGPKQFSISHHLNMMRVLLT
jgi:hypothetical protein